MSPHIQNKPRILIIDDEPDITDFLERYLALLSYPVESTNDPEAGWAQIQKDPPAIVLLDILMPKLDGLELLKRIKAHDGMIQVIMITGFITRPKIQEALRLGANHCLLKPFEDLEQIQKEIEHAAWRRHLWEETLKRCPEKITRTSVEGSLTCPA